MIYSKIDLVSWVNTIEADSNILNGAVDGILLGNHRFKSKDEYECLVSFFHETIHFWQAISTIFVYDLSLRYLEFYKQMCSVMKETEYFEKILPEMVSCERKIWQNNLEIPSSCPVNNLEIIEGCAVYNAYRLIEQNPSHNNFLDYLQQCHPGQLQYQNAYKYAAKTFGDEIYDWFPVICYFSLQTRRPAVTFIDILAFLTDYKKSNVTDYYIALNEPFATLTVFSERIPGFIRLIPNLNNVKSHDALDPYIKYLSYLVEIDAGFILEEFLCQPYLYLRGELMMKDKTKTLIRTFRDLFYIKGNRPEYFVEMNDFLNLKLLPPIFITRHPKHDNINRSLDFTFCGLASEMSQEDSSTHYLRYLRSWTATIGVLQALLAEDKDMIPSLCQHKTCSLFESKMCCKYLMMFPFEAKEQCNFDDFFTFQFKRNIYEFIEV